jgi:3-dehydroquinate dehydratase II
MGNAILLINGQTSTSSGPASHIYTGTPLSPT